jgi:hypothetical protein
MSRFAFFYIQGLHLFASTLSDCRRSSRVYGITVFSFLNL